MRHLVKLFITTVLIACGTSLPVAADTALEVRPLIVQTILAPAEKQQGFIDLTNPTTNDLILTLEVQGFKQLNNQGTLAFFDSEQLKAGITLDYESVAIPAQKTLRLIYQVDGTKLPEGDVFAAIFAKGAEGDTRTAPGVRVGTLLVITNGTNTNHQAEITETDIPWLQTSGALKGSVALTNTAPINTANGFFPDIQLSLWPFGPSTTVQGPLVFSGITRTVEIDAFKNTFGIYKLTVATGTSTKEQLVILLPPAWIVAIIALIALIALVIWRIKTRHKRILTKHRPRPLKK